MDNPYLTFDQWIDAVFNHPVSEPAWYFTAETDSVELWTLESKFPQVQAEYVARTFQEIAKFSQIYSDGQIAAGLQYIINPACSGVVYAIVDPRLEVDLVTRIRCCEAIYTVYEQLFAVRCTPILATAKQKPQERNPLNNICFMWWDIFPAPIIAIEDEPSPVDDALLGVIVKTLSLDSEVCKESALHGLNEWAFGYPKRVKAIVDEFLASQPNISPELKAYAEKAGRGALP
jgi:hypothetical protein